MGARARLPPGALLAAPLFFFAVPSGGVSRLPPPRSAPQNQIERLNVDAAMEIPGWKRQWRALRRARLPTPPLLAQALLALATLVFALTALPLSSDAILLWPPGAPIYLVSGDARRFTDPSTQSRLRPAPWRRGRRSPSARTRGSAG